MGLILFGGLDCIVHSQPEVFMSSSLLWALQGWTKEERDELDSAKDLPLQCDFWAVHVGLVGALSLQYPIISLPIFYFLFSFVDMDMANLSYLMLLK